MRLHLFTTDDALRRLQRQVSGAPEYQGIDAGPGRLDVPRERWRLEIEDEREIRLHARARQLAYLLVAGARHAPGRPRAVMGQPAGRRRPQADPRGRLAPRPERMQNRRAGPTAPLRVGPSRRRHHGEWPH